MPSPFLKCVSRVALLIVTINIWTTLVSAQIDAQPRVWITVSSVVEKFRTNGLRGVAQRKLELNWKNLPINNNEKVNYWIGLFDNLDSVRTVQPEDALVVLNPAPVPRGRFRTDIEFPIHVFNVNNLTSDCLGFHIMLVKGETPVARNCIRPRPFWMSENLDNLEEKAIKDIMIPGAHNSGSYEVGYHPESRALLRKYVICHDESVFNQLAWGLRYLDLRVSYEPVKDHPEKLWIVHGILRTEVTLDDVLVQVKAFLDATDKEVVIIDFHRFEKGFDDFPRDENTNLITQRRHEEVHAKLEKHLKKHMSSDLHGYNVKFGDLIRSNKRLVVGYAANRFLRHAHLYPRVKHLWAEAENVTTLEKYFERTLCLNSGYEATSAMAQLTPNTWGVIFDKYGGLRKMAQDVNYLISQWFSERWWRCANVVATDFFLGNNLIEISIEANRKRPVVPAIRRAKRSAGFIESLRNYFFN